MVRVFQSTQADQEPVVNCLGNNDAVVAQGFNPADITWDLTKGHANGHAGVDLHRDLSLSFPSSHL